MKKAIYLLAAFGMLLLFHRHQVLPESTPLEVSPLRTAHTAYLLPLDSRPVCTDYPQKIAKLAGTALILPPKELLDNYRQPGDTQKLQAWLQDSANNKIGDFYVSSEMLLYGGLIASRQHSLPLKYQLEKINSVVTISKKNSTNFKIFSLIPRLLVSDELIPDRWYKYRLFRYSQFYHQAMVTGEYLPALKQKEYADAVPEKILAKYQNLFTNNYLLNKSLLQRSSNQLEIILGQDDGHPWGLPTYTAELLENQLSKNPGLNGSLTYGADEIASCLIAKSYLQQQKKQPKFFIQYADSSLPNLYMPYLAATIDAVLRDKLKLVGANATDTLQQADIVLYVNCGHDNYRPNLQQAKELEQLLEKRPNVALIDLTANFETEELLLPYLLKTHVPLSRLIAYSGWNTFSNSAGTAVAQAAIMWGRKKELKQTSEQLTLHTYNLKLLTEQLLDNYYYQKEYHAKLKQNLLWRGVEPTNLSNKDKAVAEAFIRQFIKNKGQDLLKKNLGQSPFYTDDNGKYYLKAFTTTTRLPWNRIFEIDLQVQNLQVGYQSK